jgi:hypothetical protein
MHGCALFPERTAVLAGVGGTITVLAALDAGMATYDPAQLEGSFMSRERVLALVDQLVRSTRPSAAACPSWERARRHRRDRRAGGRGAAEPVSGPGVSCAPPRDSVTAWPGWRPRSGDRAGPPTTESAGSVSRNSAGNTHFPEPSSSRIAIDGHFTRADTPTQVIAGPLKNSTIRPVPPSGRPQVSFHVKREPVSEGAQSHVHG